MAKAFPSRNPKYRKHKSGQARVTIGRKTFYLGKYAALRVRKPESSVSNVLLSYWRHAEQHYRTVDCKPTSELATIKTVLRIVRELYGCTAASKFSPLALKAVRNG
jgi:hypothetical protein